MTNEKLISLVYSKPEIWDQNCKNYSNKEVKLKAWTVIGEKMNCPVSHVKVRWTNLRDLFRRELKKTLKMAKMTGDPESYTPRWKYFKSLLFLKDQMVKNFDLQSSSLPLDESMSKYYPQMVPEDEDRKSEEQCYSVNSSQSSHMNTQLTSSNKKQHENLNLYDRMERYNKRQCLEETSFVDVHENYVAESSVIHDEDEDYHFVMSVLPSIRRIPLDRKTSFRMKVLQLIMEEEIYFME